jgi:putative ABC transport system permease protein
MLLDGWTGDVRFGCRMLVTRPGFTLLVVLTLALGFGAGSAVFAIADAVLIRALPYREPGRLAFLWQTLPSQNVYELEATPADYVAWKALKSFSTLAMVFTESVTLTGSTEAERVRGARVTASAFPLLGLRPQIGRPFDSTEDDGGATPVAILSDGLWRRRYGATPDIVGQTIAVNGTSHTIVGVMAPNVVLPGPLAAFSDLWLPSRLTLAERENAISHNYTVVGRLADGVSIQAAESEIAAFASRLSVQQPDTHTALGARIVSIADDTIKGIKPTLIVLVGGVVLLLLITCANVSTLLMVHTAGRQHDTAIRIALGASRGRLAMLSVAQTMLLALAGGAAGLILGQWLLTAVMPTIGASLPPSAIAHVDARTVGVTTAVALLFGGALGLVAGRPSSSEKLRDALRSGSRTFSAPDVTRARDLLVIMQVAFAMMLLAASGLMIHSVVRLSKVSLGFSPDRVLTFRLSLDGDRYREGESRSALVADLMRRFDGAAGIERAGATSRLPLGGARGANGVEIEGQPARRGELRIVDQRHVTADYFGTMGIRLLRGRGLTSTDDALAEPVVVINHTMAERFWPGANPLDHRVRLGVGFDSGQWFRIVGVVDDVRHVALTRPAVAEMYRPYAQAPATDLVVVLKSRSSFTAAAATARSTVQALDADLPLYDVRTMDDRVGGSFAQLRATVLLLGITAALAATLAAIAIYGSIWYSVTQRIPEIGLRVALGAPPASIWGRVLRHAYRLTATGGAVGVAGTAATSSVMRSLLFDTSATDAVTYASVVAMLVVLTAAASIVPARRAMRIDPIIALKTE